MNPDNEVEIATKNVGARYIGRFGVKDTSIKEKGRLDLGGPDYSGRDSFFDSLRSRASKTKIFGQNLAGLTGGLMGGAAHYIWNHKAEIALAGGAGFTAKTVTRVLLASSGAGIAVGIAAGAAGGAASGAAKEYFKQRKDIHLTETSRALIVGGLKNEFRRVRLAKKRDIAGAAAKGAAIGLVSWVVIGEVIPLLTDWAAAHNETAHAVITPIREQIQEKTAGLEQFIKERFSGTGQPPGVKASGGEVPTASPTSTPAATETILSPAISTPAAEIASPTATDTAVDRTATALSTATGTPLPTETPSPTATATAPAPSAAPGAGVPGGAPTPEATGVPRGPVLPPEATPAVPKPAVESIKLPAGSNIWNEMDKYLTEKLGRPPTAAEIAQASQRVLSENNITDATKIPADTRLNITAVNEYLNELKPKPPVPAETLGPQPTTPPAPTPETSGIQPAPTEPTIKPIPPTEVYGGHIVTGSVLDNNLTFDGKPWVLLENGTKNINYLFEAAGEASPVNHQALAVNLQQAIDLRAHGQLKPSLHPDLYTLFHLSNGTASIYSSLLDDDEGTLKSLIRLGIVRK